MVSSSLLYSHSTIQTSPAAIPADTPLPANLGVQPSYSDRFENTVSNGIEKIAHVEKKIEEKVIETAKDTLTEAAKEVPTRIASLQETAAFLGKYALEGMNKKIMMALALQNVIPAIMELSIFAGPIGFLLIPLGMAIQGIGEKGVQNLKLHHEKGGTPRIVTLFQEISHGKKDLPKIAMEQLKKLFDEIIERAKVLNYKNIIDIAEKAKQKIESDYSVTLLKILGFNQDFNNSALGWTIHKTGMIGKKIALLRPISFIIGIFTRFSYLGFRYIIEKFLE